MREKKNFFKNIWNDLLENLFEFLKISFVFIWLIPFMLLTCSSSNNRQEKALDSEGIAFLKTIRKYVIVVGSFESIVTTPVTPKKQSSNSSKQEIARMRANIESMKAIGGDVSSLEKALDAMSKLVEEDSTTSISKNIDVSIKQASLKEESPSIFVSVDSKEIASTNFKESLVSLGNKKANQINLEDLGLIATESSEERIRWLKTSGIDTIVEINFANLSLDYNTRVPDLKVLNSLYTFFLLDIWWIDMIGIWSLEGDVNVKITNLSNGKQYSGSSVYKTVSTGSFILSRMNSKSMNESISNITKSALANIVKTEKSL